MQPTLGASSAPLQISSSETKPIELFTWYLNCSTMLLAHGLDLDNVLHISTAKFSFSVSLLSVEATDEATRAGLDHSVDFFTCDNEAAADTSRSRRPFSFSSSTLGCQYLLQIFHSISSAPSIPQRRAHGL